MIHIYHKFQISAGSVIHAYGRNLLFAIFFYWTKLNMVFPVAFTNIKCPNPIAVEAFIVKKMLTDHLNPGHLKVKKLNFF